LWLAAFCILLAHLAFYLGMAEVGLAAILSAVLSMPSDLQRKSPKRKTLEPKEGPSILEQLHEERERRERDKWR
jgi:hypothetical protein